MRTSNLRRLALGAAALPIALAGLTACGSDSEPDSASDSNSSADSSAEGAGAESGEEIDPADFVADYKDAFSKETTAHMTMETGGQASFSAEGDIDYSSTPPSMAMTMSGPMTGQGLDLRLVDGSFYMSIPGGGGDKFYSFDLDDPSNPLGKDFTKQLDPATAFDQFEDAITSVTFVGEEDVDGDEMKHYSLVVDGAKVAGSVATDAPEGVLPDELKYDVWLDGEGLFRKMESDLGEAGTLTMNVDDWGKDVSIEAPPADQVTTMPEMPTMDPSA